jgi:hypothetical protein
MRKFMMLIGFAALLGGAPVSVQALPVDKGVATQEQPSTETVRYRRYYRPRHVVRHHYYRPPYVVRRHYYRPRYYAPRYRYHRPYGQPYNGSYRRYGW